MEYVIRHIGDICKKVCSGGTPTSSNMSYYEGGTIPWLNTNEVNFCNIYDTTKKITEEGLNNSAAKFIPENSVIVAMYGVTAGKSAITKIPLTTNQACCNLIIDENQADYRYVYYFLQQQCDNLNKLANGGAQQNLNALIIKRFKISLPNLKIQRKIASILSAYDSLIENNTKRIRLLEQMAENLYKEWFVRFRFPGYENTEFVDGLPKGWKSYTIKELCSINQQTLNTKNKRNVIKYLDTGSITDNSIENIEEYCVLEAPSRARRVVKENSIIFSTVRPILRHLGIMKDIPENLIVSTGFAVFDVREDIANIVYMFLSSQEVVKYCQMIAEGSVATYPSIKPEEIGRLRISIPSMEIAIKWNAQLELIFLEKNKLQHQSALLTRQRDLLLPRLMSGKLEVKA